MSPYIAEKGLWLGLPFEHVVSFTNGWMGAGTWGLVQCVSYTISDGTRDMRM